MEYTNCTLLNATLGNHHGSEHTAGWQRTFGTCNPASLGVREGACVCLEEEKKKEKKKRCESVDSVLTQVRSWVDIRAAFLFDDNLAEMIPRTKEKRRKRVFSILFFFSFYMNESDYYTL